MIKKIWVLLAISITCFNCYADGDDVVVTNNLTAAPVMSSINTTLGVSSNDIKKNAPIEYTVKKNDTVSKISSMYLKKIGLWSQFLGVDRLSDTKLYPGDKLKIVSLDGRKILIVAVIGGRDNYYEKLTPTVRTISMDSLPPIPTAQLRNMFSSPIVISPKIFESLPMIIGGSNPSGLYYSMGDNVYVRNYTGGVGDRVMVISRFRDLIDPDTKEVLGNEYRWDGEGVMTQVGDVSSLEPTKVQFQMTALDRIMPAEDLFAENIVPHKSDYIIDGKIIAMYDSLTSTGQNNSVVINRGIRDGVQVGTVFDITDGHTFVDPTSPTDNPKYISAPEMSIGELLVYKVYDKVAFALVTDSIKEIPLYAKIKSQ